MNLRLYSRRSTEDAWKGARNQSRCPEFAAVPVPANSSLPGNSCKKRAAPANATQEAPLTVRDAQLVCAAVPVVIPNRLYARPALFEKVMKLVSPMLAALMGLFTIIPSVVERHPAVPFTPDRQPLNRRACPAADAESHGPAAGHVKFVPPTAAGSLLQGLSEDALLGYSAARFPGRTGSAAELDADVALNTAIASPRAKPAFLRPNSARIRKQLFSTVFTSAYCYLFGSPMKITEISILARRSNQRCSERCRKSSTGKISRLD